ncbi:MAG: InlB B-repeat-containing protein, partial [Clostridia bacterium]|nr:InlB B-repeat-containing protein [Clostridia bacterium]
MIVPMKKVSFMIMGDKKKDTLKKLRKLGILHIEITEGSGKKLEELKEQITLLESAIFSVSEKKNKNIEMKDASKDEVLTISKEIYSLTEEKKTCLNEKVTLSSELERIKKWGGIDPEVIADLSEKGVEVSFYEMPPSEYENLGESVKTVSMEKTKNSVKFLLVKSGIEGEDEVIDSLKNYKFELPKISNQEITSKIEEKTSRIAEIDEKISSYASFAKSMKNAIKTCEKEIEFEVYNTGMADESVSADGNVSIAYFTGYVEEENLPKIKETAKENSWGLLVSDPTEEDNVPTKLKNNKFVSLIYPLTDFLGTVPGYFEYDISGWFLGFILIFFGIIFGDGVYGLLLTVVAATLIIKNKTAKKPTNPTKEGYIFDAWYYDDVIFDFDTKITEDITLTAKWIEHSETDKDEQNFIVRFDTKGGNTLTSIVVKEGMLLDKPANPTKDGYEFVSWQLNGVDFDFTNEITSDITLIATWKEVKKPENNKPVTPAPKPTVNVSGVSISKSSLNLKVGDSDTLTATISPDNATNKTV